VPDLKPYAVILVTERNRYGHEKRRMTVRILAQDREDALRLAPEIYSGEAIAAQYCPFPLI
jgi:hypothetical protein